MQTPCTTLEHCCSMQPSGGTDEQCKAPDALISGDARCAQCNQWGQVEINQGTVRWIPPTSMRGGALAAGYTVSLDGIVYVTVSNQTKMHAVSALPQ